MIIEGTGMKFLKIIWEIIKSIVLMTGLIIFVVVWCVVIFFLWIYDAIFGGWEK
jgi:heme/copper-type cytochrome/quinol oxidase subunit 2